MGLIKKSGCFGFGASYTMEALRIASLLLLSLSMGEVFGYEIQPVDAVLFIDGAPTYMRMTNSTSLENVYSCILETSENVNSVIMATQMKGLLLDVGQVEESINESIRRLSGRIGQSLWKSEEELKMLKDRMARFLTIDYYENKPDPEGYKIQRSTDWSHGRGPPSGWRELPFATLEQKKESTTHLMDTHPVSTSGKTNQPSFSTSTSRPPTGRTVTKTNSIPTKNYTTPGTTTSYNITPDWSLKLHSWGEHVKTERPDTIDGDTSGGKIITVGYAPLQEFKNVVGEANATDVFIQTLTKEDDDAAWSSASSSEDEEKKVGLP